VCSTIVSTSEWSTLENPAGSAPDAPSRRVISNTTGDRPVRTASPHPAAAIVAAVSRIATVRRAGRGHVPSAGSKPAHPMGNLWMPPKLDPGIPNSELGPDSEFRTLKSEFEISSA
jgi:hypothetical protein